MSSKNVETGTATSQGGSSYSLNFKIVTCGRYVVYLALVYYFMVLSQMCNLYFMTFGERAPKVIDACAKTYPNYLATKTCNVTNCWVKTNENDYVICSKSTFDFISIRYDFKVPSWVKVSITIQNFGLMIGAIVAGNLADIFGRKKILFPFTMGLVLFPFVTPFSQTFTAFTILRFIAMIFTGGKHCVCNPYFMENLPDHHRMWVATVITYSPNLMVLAGIAYLCKRWQVLSWAAAGIAVLPLVTIPFLMETPRWLIKQGRGKEAAAAAIYIRRWDGKLPPEKEKEITDAIKKAAAKELEKRRIRKKNYYFYHLFTDWKLGTYAVVFAISLFSTSLISYGIAYNLNELAGTVYINLAILGAARWTVNIVAASLDFSIKSIGRRLLHLVAAGSTAFIMAVLFIIHLATWRRIDAYKAVERAGDKGEASIYVIVMFTRYACLLAAALCTELYVLNAVQPAELFPTPIRSASLAFVEVFNRVGNIISPLVFMPSKKWPPAPFLLMFLTSATDFVLYFFLIPETRGKKIPDHMPGEGAAGSLEEMVSTQVTASPGMAGESKKKGDTETSEVKGSESGDSKASAESDKESKENEAGSKRDKKESKDKGKKNDEGSRSEEGSKESKGGNKDESG